jgi:hypothetical protein
MAQHLLLVMVGEVGHSLHLFHLRFLVAGHGIRQALLFMLVVLVLVMAALLLLAVVVVKVLLVQMQLLRTAAMAVRV